MQAPGGSVRTCKPGCSPLQTRLLQPDQNYYPVQANQKTLLRHPISDPPNEARSTYTAHVQLLKLMHRMLTITLPNCMQVRELLKRKRFDQALDLIAVACSPDTGSSTISLASAGSNTQGVKGASHQGGAHPEWTEIALAQAGVLMLADTLFDQGLAVLERCSPAVFQPSQLLALFPEYTTR